MSAPARVDGPARRTPAKERGKERTAQPESAGARTRSAAATKAYARRAQRSGDRELTGPRQERGRASASRVSFVVLVMALLVIGVVATLWFATQSTADSYKLEQIKENTQQISERVQQLQQQVAQGESPESLAARAQQLGLVPAGDPAHLVVGPNGQVVVVGTPSAAQPPPPPVTSPPPAGTTPPASTTSPAGSTSPAAPPPASGAATGTTAAPPAGG